MNVLIDDNSLSAIANSIRARNGTQNTYKPSEMANAIDNLPSGDSLNVYAQSTEPTEKDGIWIKTTTSKYNYTGVEIVDEITTEGTYTRLTYIPYQFYNGSAVAIGTDVYLFGGTSGKTTAYKYDTLTDTYTKLTDIPYNFYNGDAVAIGTDIYLFGSSTSGYRKYAYKYNTLTNSYTQLTYIPYNFQYGSAVAIGTDVYLFGGTSGNTTAYEYDTLTDTYTKLTDIPYSFSVGSAVSIGTNVYL